MDQTLGRMEDRSAEELDRAPILTDDTRFQLGLGLRSIYADLCDAQPIPDAQIDLLLRLRHKERDRRRG